MRCGRSNGSYKTYVPTFISAGVTPLLVYDAPERIWLMNTVWFVPAAVGSLLTMWKVSPRVSQSRAIPDLGVLVREITGKN